MKHRDFYLMQMKREGYKQPVEHDIELYARLGSKRFSKLMEAGFNFAYAESSLHVPPKQGTYQRDMTFIQSMINATAYRRLIKEEESDAWFDGFISNLSENMCFEKIRQKTAAKKLDDIVRYDTSSCECVDLKPDES